MNIHSGEPVPPGFEDDLSRSAQIKPVIDRYKSGALIGLEFTVEVYSAKDKEPFYQCLLCEKRGDPRTIFSHWISLNHRMKYLEKYFPTVSEQISVYKYPDNNRVNLPGQIQIIIEAIEKRYGRLYPFVYERSYFQKNRDSIAEDIEDSEHFDERRGETFLSTIDRRVLDPSGSSEKRKAKDPSPPIVKPPVKRMGPIKVTLNTKSLPNESLDAISSDEESTKRKKREQSPAYRVTPRVHRSPPFDEPTAKKENLKDKNPFPSPRELSLQAGQIAQEKYKWEKYRFSAELAEKDLLKKLKEFEKNPEKHPMYPEEWKKFWNRRYKELQMQKKDPNNYDYKPEWIVFWTRRMKELHDKDFEKKKVEIKLKLGLPPDGEEMTDALKSQYKVDNPKNKLTEQVIDISDEEDSFLEINSKRRNTKDRNVKSNPPAKDQRNSRDRRDTKERDIRKKRRSLSRSLSPLSDESDSSYRRKKKDHRSRSRSRDRSMSRDREWDRKYPAHPYPYPPYGRGFPPMYPRPVGYPPYGAPYRPPYSKYPKYEEYEENSKSPIPSEHRKKEPVVKEEEPESDEPLTVVAVLRLLTALEDFLGSLGPKVVDMLGKALALEKIKSNSSDDLLINEDNCVFFETIKEKLKGQLLANVLDDQLKIKAIKKAIKNIAGIIYQVSSKATKKESSNPNDSSEKEKQPAVPRTAKRISDLPFERSVVSSKLAAALVTEGKEDVSTEDMDKMIFLLILMVKLSKGSDKNVNSKEICEFLKIARPKSPTPPPPKQVIDMFSKEEIESMKLVVNAKEVRKEDDNSNDEPKDTGLASGLDCLTDSDLQTLLQNFKHLSSEEQHHLIAHLKKLESTDPLRVEKLRKYVNISDDDKSKKKPTFEVDDDDDDDDSRSRSMSYSNREESPPPPPPSCKPDARKISISDDEDDEDYNFEDVVKSITASNLQPKQALNPTRSSMPSTSKSTTKSTPPISITDTQNLIANLMGSLQKTGIPQPTPAPQPPKPQPPQPQHPSSASSLPYYQQTSQQQQFISYPHLNPQQQQHPQMNQMNTANPYYNYYQQQPQAPQQMNYNNAYNMQGYPPQQGVPQNYNMFNQNMPMNNGRQHGGNY
ncbi:hypothetical protein ACFFRR_009086 [Megaselia abdita]